MRRCVHARSPLGSDRNSRSGPRKPHHGHTTAKQAGDQCAQPYYLSTTAAATPKCLISPSVMHLSSVREPFYETSRQLAHPRVCWSSAKLRFYGFLQAKTKVPIRFCLISRIRRYHATSGAPPPFPSDVASVLLPAPCGRVKHS